MVVQTRARPLAGGSPFIRHSSFVMSSFPLAPSRPNRLPSLFSRADAVALLEGEDEDLAVADLAVALGAGGFEDGLDGGLDEVLVDRDLQLDLGKQPDDALAAAEGFLEPALAAAAADVG